MPPDEGGGVCHHLVVHDWSVRNGVGDPVLQHAGLGEPTLRCDGVVVLGLELVRQAAVARHALVREVMINPNDAAPEPGLVVLEQAVEGAVEEAVRISLKKTHLYMQTQAGHIHKDWCKERINLKDQLFKKKKPKLAPDEILAQEALVSFELFDRDGSGRIDEDELAEMLVQLAIPANEETVKRLAQEIDTDGGGDIDFGEFLEWYTGGGSDDVTANASLEDQMFKQLLKLVTAYC